MARIRNIKPTFFTDADLCELSPLHRLLFIGLWTQADRSGALEDKPRELKVQIFPFDDCDLDSMMWDLADAGFIVRYAVEGRRYALIPKFTEHQRPHKEERASRIPTPEHGQSLTRCTVVETPRFSVERQKSLSNDRGVGATPSPSPSPSPSPETEGGSQKKEASAQAGNTPQDQLNAPSAGTVTERPSSRPPENAVSPEVALWLRFLAARAKALPEALEDPKPPEWAMWRVEALRAVAGDVERLVRGYEAYLQDGFWRKQRRPNPIGGWMKQWRDFIPDQATPAPVKYRIYGPGEDPYENEMPEHLRRPKAAQS